MRLIDVDDAIERLRKAEAKMHAINGVKAVDIGTVISFMQNQLVVDAVPVVHGRWIHPKGYVVSNGFKCSVCGHEEASHYPINPRPGGMCIADENGNFFHPPKINYCPNCGAKMDGGNEE